MEGAAASGSHDGQIASPRRTPSQQRSRERVERMLAAASALIAEQGSDAMRVGEVAERAGVSIGSLYQFFPDKRAIVWALAERHTAESQACIAAALAEVADAEGLRRAFSELVDVYYRLFLAEPVMRDIWSGTQADKALRELELADSRAIGALLAAVLKRLRPQDDAVALEAKAFLVWQLGETAVRLAVAVGRTEGDSFVETYKRMALRELLGA
jgi:AcrR family transcriptional regulator